MVQEHKSHVLQPEKFRYTIAMRKLGMILDFILIEYNRDDHQLSDFESALYKSLFQVGGAD